MVAILLEARQLWSTAPPEVRSRLSNWPTVLFSWWCTSFAAVIIITRVLARKVRSDMLFREDWIMLFSCIPMFIRMVLIHFVLIYGTNNISLDHVFTETQLEHHSIGARLVLAARIFYALTIWLNKLTVSEFLKRITMRVWRRSWEVTLQGIRIFLLVTFVAVVIATLTECQPFHHYWQVMPDPGAHCRQGFAQLLTMGICDIVTDIVLIAFPIPIVLQSGQSWKRKLQMICLFSLSVIMIAVTATRMPEVIAHRGRQQYRTVWASCEILASVSVSNGVILGSFLRDKGTKKNKYRNQSFTDSVDGGSTRRPTLVTLQSDDSEENLFRSVGIRMPAHLKSGKSLTSPRPAPPALPAKQSHHRSKHGHPSGDTTDEERSSDSDYSMQKPGLPEAMPSPSPSTTLGFFDVGNLLEHNHHAREGQSYFPPPTIISSGTSAVDFAISSPSPHNRSGSRTFLREVSGMLRGRDGSASPRQRPSSRTHSRNRSAPIGVLGPRLERHETQVSLQDAGGLLHPNSAAHAFQEYEMSGAQPSHFQLTEEDIELDDIGVLQGDLRRNQGVAVSLQEILGGEQDHRPVTAPPPQLHDSFEDMIIHDPGGLMK